MIFIGISGKRRTGKTSLANILGEEYGYRVRHLADPLKAICRENFRLTHEQTDGIFKESPTHYRQNNALLTPRQIMIQTGMFYRSIDPNFWIGKVFEGANLFPDRDLVIPDVRFLNEVKAFKAKENALLIRLNRNEKYTGINIDDPSETELDSYTSWDLEIPEKDNERLEQLYDVAYTVHQLVLAKRR